MAAEIAEPGSASWADAPFGARLAAAGAAVAELAASGLGQVADEDLAGVMGELTTLVGRLDGLRVAVTRQVRDRGVWRRRGATSVAGWLRADPRTADLASSLARLAAMAPELPQTTALLTAGQVSLAQAGSVCWQVAHLPDVPQKPQDADERAALLDPEPEGEQPEEEMWAGLWRHGDVHAAADNLFARFLPRLDSAQLRELGAHLREAADAQERAAEDYNAYAHRSVRLSRSIGGTGELSGRLHPEAAAQVIDAFEDLGAKAGPGDTRTKAQRWADALVYLTSLAGPSAPVPEPTSPHPQTASDPNSASPGSPGLGSAGLGSIDRGSPGLGSPGLGPGPGSGSGSVGRSRSRFWWARSWFYGHWSRSRSRS